MQLARTGTASISPLEDLFAKDECFENICKEVCKFVFKNERTYSVIT